MTKHDDTSMAEQNAESGGGRGEWPVAWIEAGPAAAGGGGASRSQVPVVEVTVTIDEDVYEAAMLRATYDGYDSASEVVEEALREWGRGY